MLSPQLRRPNWSYTEIEALREAVYKRSKCLFSRNSDFNTQTKKNQNWVAVSEAVNTSAGQNRTGNECRKKWTDMQSKERKRVADEKRSVQKRGGGLPATLPRQLTEDVSGGGDSLENSSSQLSEEILFVVPPTKKQKIKTDSLLELEVERLQVEKARLRCEERRLEIEEKRMLLDEKRLDIEAKWLELLLA